MGAAAFRRWGFTAALLGVPALWGGAVAAGKPPVVDQVVEGRRTGDHRAVLRLRGKGLKKVAGARLLTPEGAEAGALEVLSAASKAATLLLPEGLEPGAYDLELSMARGDPVVLRVSVTAGGLLPGSVSGEALDPLLKQTLDDAYTLAGEEPVFYVDAGNVATGTLPPARFSSLADLLEEEFIGSDGRLRPFLFAAAEDLEEEGYLEGGILRTDHFSAWSDLVAAGVVDGNGALSPASFSAWKDLLAEGRLDGSGHLGTASYSAWDDLENEGKIDAFGRLKTDFFTAYGSLNAAGKIGSLAGQVAAGDHDHAGVLVPVAGGTVTGTLKIAIAGSGQALSISGPGYYSSADSELVRGDFLGTTTLGYGVHVVKVANVTADSEGAVKAVWDPNGGYAAAMGISASTSGTGICLQQDGIGGFAGDSWGGALSSTVDLHALNDGGGIGLHAETVDATDPVVAVSLYPSSTYRAGSSMALFTAGTTDVARIDMDGKGYFNGGYQTGGADFAEKVATAEPASALEPGDVMAVDPAGVRRFTLSRTAASPLVAGVISARPGVVASPGPVAGGNGGEGAILGIVGILPVKVCDEGGPIRPGDLLETASLPGHARKAGPRPRAGTLLGRALGGLASGRGTVEVLVRVR